MKTRFNKVGFILGLGLLSLPAVAQTGPEITGQVSSQNALSLAQAQSEAAEKNPGLQRMEARTHRMGWGKLNAWSGQLPKISIDYDQYLGVKYLNESLLFNGAPVTIPGAFPTSNLTFSASLTLFDGLKTIHEIQAANKNSDASELEYSRAKFQLNEDVRVRFFRAVAAQRLLEVAVQNVKTLDDHLTIAKSSERAGYGLRVDVLRIQASLEEARAEAISAQDNVDITRSELNEILGNEVADPRPLQGDLPVFKANDIPEDLKLTLDRREDVKAQALQESASDDLSAAAKGAWLPSVALFGQMQYYKFGDADPIIIQTSLQNDYAIGLRFSWSLFDGGSTIARERMATYQAKEDAASLKSTYTKLPREFLTWKKKFYYNVSLYEARLRTLEQSQESVRLSVAGAKAGTRTNTEVLDAELDLFRARAGIIRAQSDAVEAVSQLELAVGYPLRMTKR